MLCQLTAILLCSVMNNAESLNIDKLPEQMGSWIREPKVSEFLPDTLFDYIDGDADRYLPYNFEKLTVLFYKNSDPENDIEIQIYQMATQLDAFGIYSVHRDRNKDIFPFGEDGFVGENQAMFYQARYFIKLMVKKTENARSNLELFGKEVSKMLPETKDIIPERICLEHETKIHRSECYLAKDVLAQSFLPRGMTALYKIKDKTATGFVVMFKDEVETNKGWGGYKKYLDEIGAEYQSQSNEIMVFSPESETAVVSLVKNRMVGVWMPGGDIPELQKIQHTIQKCLVENMRTKADILKK